MYKGVSAMTKKRKLALYGVLLVLLAASSVYFRPMRLTGLLSDYQEGSPEKIASSVFFSAHSSKELEVAQAEDIQNILSLLVGVQVRRALLPPQEYNPKFKQTYDLTLHYPGGREVEVDILSKELLRIDRTTYSIVQAPGLEKLYDLLVAAQPEGAINPFYYGQLCELDF